MKIITFENNKTYSVRSIFEWLSIQEEIIESMKEIDIEKEENVEKTDMMNYYSSMSRELLKIQDDNRINLIRNFCIYKTDEYCYYMMCYVSENVADENAFMSKIIDNAYIDDYNPRYSIEHNYKCVFYKINNTSLLDISIQEIINVLEQIIIPNALIVSNDSITTKKYNNNPAFGYEVYNVDINIPFGLSNIRINVANDNNNDEIINVDEYENEILKKVLSTYDLLHNKKFFKNAYLIVSLHQNNVNISITEEVEKKVIKILSNISL